MSGVSRGSATGPGDGGSVWPGVPLAPVEFRQPPTTIQPAPAAPVHGVRQPTPVQPPEPQPDARPQPVAVQWVLPAGAPVRPRGGVGRGVLAGVLTVCLLLGGGAVAWYLQRPAPAADAPAAAPSSIPAPGGAAKSEIPGDPPAAPTAPGGTPPAPPPIPSPAAPPSPQLSEPQALDQLHQLRAATLGGLVLDGRWVAQVAGKYVGIEDPLQTAPNGTHVFYAVDILAENRSTLDRASRPELVLTLWATDFGSGNRYGPDLLPYWLTLVDEGFATSDDVELWCARAYPEYTPRELANGCVARRLSPPS